MMFVAGPPSTLGKFRTPIGQICSVTLLAREPSSTVQHTTA